MMTIELICVGRLKERFYAAAAEEYVKRLSAFCRISVTELPEKRLPDHPSPALVDAALRQEGALILRRLPKCGAVVALCVEGEQYSSPDFAAWLQRQTVAGCSRMALIIGGSCGLHEDVKRRAGLRLSFSPMTFPHHLARVMALEQLYRAFQINAGTAYHK